jgi:hypothetical protein
LKEKYDYESLQPGRQLYKLLPFHVSVSQAESPFGCIFTTKKKKLNSTYLKRKKKKETQIE